MIQGLTLRPWLEVEAHREPSGIFAQLLDCKTCKTMRPLEQRQGIGCGLEPPIAHARPLLPPSYCKHNRNPDAVPTVCPGYLVSLPAVLERTWHAYWSKTPHLAAKLGGDPTEQDLAEIEVLEASRSAAESWAMANPVKRSS